MRTRKHRTEDGETNYWLSYSDMMAALLLIFVLVISFTMLQAKGQLETQKSKYEELHQLALEQKEQLDHVLGIRRDLIKALSDEFSDSSLKIAIDQETGSITFDSNILFDRNRSNLKPSGEAFLREFLPKYFDVLFKEEFKDRIGEIIIEGHTDTDGDYFFNLELSQKRSLTVSNFCLRSGNGFLSDDIINDLRRIVTANGRSFSNPIYIEGDPEKGVDMDASRRVEFKFRLKDEESIAEMLKILSE